METQTESRPEGRVSLREVIHRVNNLTATLLAESELALLAGESEGHVKALRRVVETVDRMRIYLGDVQRREEASCAEGNAGG